MVLSMKGSKAGFTLDLLPLVLVHKSMYLEHHFKKVFTNQDTKEPSSQSEPLTGPLNTIILMEHLEEIF